MRTLLRFLLLTAMTVPGLQAQPAALENGGITAGFRIDGWEGENVIVDTGAQLGILTS